MMNFTLKGFESNKINVSNKVTTLNPNAAEFVPSSLRSPHGNTKSAGTVKGDSIGNSGTAVPGHSESYVSNSSDDEAHQYWCRQLPDDITPDFKVVEEDEVLRLDPLSLAGLSIQEGNNTLRLSASMTTETFGKRQGKSPFGTNNMNLRENMGHSGSMFTQDSSSAALMAPSINSWGKQYINGTQQLNTRVEGHCYNVDSGAGFVNDMLGTQPVGEDAAIDTLEFLASQFPGFSIENLADMYYANGCDLNSTVKMLSQHELQEDSSFDQNLSLDSFLVRSRSNLDLQKIPPVDAHNGLLRFKGDSPQAPDRYRSSASAFGGALDYALTVRKGPAQDGIHWNHERNSTAHGSVGSRAQFHGSSYDGHGKLLYGDRSPRSIAAPIWLEPGDGVANAYPESRQEVRNLECIRDACLEQASQAFLIGNKALARELSEKGDLYNMQMKAAQERAGDAIYRKRDPVSYEFQGYSRGGQGHVINLQGYHASDALIVLKRELIALRSTAVSSLKQVQATILLGNGKGVRTSPRLPMAVEQFLLEEGLPYTQSQPGFLHVVIY